MSPLSREQGHAAANLANLAKLANLANLAKVAKVAKVAKNTSAGAIAKFGRAWQGRR